MNNSELITTQLSDELGFFFQGQGLNWSDRTKQIPDQFAAHKHAALSLWAALVETRRQLAERERVNLQLQVFTCADCGYDMTFNPADPPKCSGCKSTKWLLGRDAEVFGRVAKIVYWEKTARVANEQLAESETKFEKLKTQLTNLLHVCEVDVVAKLKKLAGK